MRYTGLAFEVPQAIVVPHGFLRGNSEVNYLSYLLCRYSSIHALFKNIILLFYSNKGVVNAFKCS